MVLLKALLLLAAPFTFALGLTLPLMRFEKFFVFEETPSLIDVTLSLAADGEGVLAIVIGLFSVVLPAVKILVLYLAALGGAERSLRLLSAVGKWSMMDVMLVALVIFAAKTSGLAAAMTQPGIWFYAAATLSTAIVAALLRPPFSQDPSGSISGT
jgi:paraquat-inducible protein A